MENKRILFALLSIFCVGLFVLLIITRTYIVDNKISEDDVVKTNDIQKIQNAIQTSVQPFFVENYGQAPENFLFYSQLQNGGVYFTSRSVIFEQQNGEERYQYTMEFFDSSNLVDVAGEEIRPTTINYFRAEKLISGIHTYSKVIYHNIYPNIDAVFFFRDGIIKYDFIISPDGDPRDITLKFLSLDSLSLSEQGDLLLHIDEQVFPHLAPFTYQENDDSSVSSWYEIDTKKRMVKFGLANYDHGKNLIIDPTLSSLTSATFLGGSATEYGGDLAVDSDGNIFITGLVTSDFPNSSGGYSTSSRGMLDIFVAKLSADLSQLQTATFLGGSNFEYTPTIAIDSSNNIFIAGRTISADFPIVSGYDNALAGTDDVFIAKLSNSLASLNASTYLGGIGSEFSGTIAIDVNNNVFVSGKTASADFPIVSGYDNALAGTDDVFIAKLSNSLASLNASTYLGG
ncbi:MAG: SBBP repeat-containing protein, partial [Candidatus Magasanikbacteria bacterium]|nr:SBBP repeat-containing protein [Candidatus Magasanikbacteria bacterium]